MKISGATLSGPSAIVILACLGMAWATPALAAWVDKSDSWCRSHGFTPPCAIWETAVRGPANDRASARVIPRSDGDNRERRTKRPDGTEDGSIFDRWGNQRQASESCRSAGGTFSASGKDPVCLKPTSSTNRKRR